ncbi:MAG: hypothetical protein HZA90_03220 [Verrucomicrobia bacterium]|nr:hypothetical protein [Verrucomicrobiota bacterium]
MIEDGAAVGGQAVGESQVAEGQLPVGVDDEEANAVGAAAVERHRLIGGHQRDIGGNDEGVGDVDRAGETKGDHAAGIEGQLEGRRIVVGEDDVRSDDIRREHEAGGQPANPPGVAQIFNLP